MASRFISWLKKTKNIGAYYGFFLPAAFLLCLALLIGAIFVGKDHREKSIRWGIDIIRGSRYPNITSENLQPQPYPEPQPQLQLEPPAQQQPTLRPQLQPLPPPPPPPPPPPQLPPLQPETQTTPQPLEVPRSNEEQICLSQDIQPQPSPQPQPQLQPPTQHQPTPRPQLQPLPPPPPPPPRPELPLQSKSQTPQQPSKIQQPHEEEQICLSQSLYRLPGSEPLPKGLVASTSDLQMQPLWGRRKKVNSTTSLFTAAVGIKQKETVDKMVRKFLSCDFTVMLFHYDGVVDAWKDLEWVNSVVHVSAVNQTKWWFAKRFLHPDIVTQYSYIFLWDEDLGVDNFDPDRYLSIVKDEGLEISQPALDRAESEVHHTITARWSNSTVHRRVKPDKHGCDPTSDYPPCTGWVELMAPVFSRAAWRCIWYMIQSDLNHAWGLDILFGYCAQGDRTKNVGVVDAEYIVHYGLPTFGERQNKEKTDTLEPNARLEVRRHSRQEYKIFKKRWQEAAKEDEYWVDPYPLSWNHSIM